MDYITYALNNYDDELEEGEEMAELGFEDVEEYKAYLQGLKEDAEESKMEERKL